MYFATVFWLITFFNVIRLQSTFFALRRYLICNLKSTSKFCTPCPEMASSGRKWPLSVCLSVGLPPLPPPLYLFPHLSVCLFSFFLLLGMSLFFSPFFLLSLSFTPALTFPPPTLLSRIRPFIYSILNHKNQLHYAAQIRVKSYTGKRASSAWADCSRRPSRCTD